MQQDQTRSITGLSRLKKIHLEYTWKIFAVSTHAQKQPREPVEPEKLKGAKFWLLKN